LQSAVINDKEFEAGEFIEFDRNEGMIDITAKENASDIIIFGGEKYTEPIVAQGPFVMNSQEEIMVAYRDFHAGKYGEMQMNLAQ
jgi:redox-sensitive bicupin YhaK (pirin superfamily)